MFTTNQVHRQGFTFLFYPMREKMLTFHWLEIPVNFIGEYHGTLFLASVDQQRRKCSILSYKEHSPLYFFYYKSVLCCLGLVFLCY